MKNFNRILLIFLWLFWQTGLWSQCPNQYIVLQNQAQVDSFPQQWPGCHHLIDHLAITGSDIVSLDSLYPIQSITGTLNFINCSSLPNLHGLENLTAVNGISFQNCVSLTSISSLSNLVSTSNLILEIYNAPLLSSLAGLEGYTNITAIGLYDVGVSSLSALSNLTHLSSLQISGCVNLTGFTPLSNLSGTIGSLNVSNCPLITSYNGLNNISTVQYEFICTNNANLSDLTALNNCSMEVEAKLGNPITSPAA